jgi:hypothetical protein
MLYMSFAAAVFCILYSEGEVSGALSPLPNNKKCMQNLAVSMSEAILFPRKLASHFLFVFFITFYAESRFKSGSGTGSVMHFGFGSCGSGFTTLLLLSFVIQCGSRSFRLCLEWFLLLFSNF